MKLIESEIKGIEDELSGPIVRGLLQSCESELTQVSNELKEFT